jgi:hypothetical protein
MWGVGIMSLILDCGTLWTCGVTKEICRVFYATISGAFGIFLQLLVPWWLWHNQKPFRLLPGWAANPDGPLKSKFTLVNKGIPVDKGDQAQVLQGLTHPLKLSAPIEYTHPLRLFSHPSGIFSSPEYIINQIYVPSGKLGFIFSLLVVLWIAKMLREVCSALSMIKFICSMPRVHGDYSYLRESAVRPSRHNHVLCRKRTNEVFALSMCSRSCITVLMLLKAAFHLGLMYLGCGCLIASDSFAGLLFTFLLLWFVGIVLQAKLIDFLLPSAIGDLKATKLAIFNEGSKREAYLCWQNFLFFTITIVLAVGVLSKPSSFIAGSVAKEFRDELMKVDTGVALEWHPELDK